MEEIDLYLEEAKDQMEKAIQHTQLELNKVRAGKAMPSMLDGLKVDYYGNPTPLNQVGSINTPDARTLVIKPWEKNIISEIERAIINSDLGFNPQNDGDIIRINIPPLSEERRAQLLKHCKQLAEQGKVSVRNARKDANDGLKKLQKDGTSEDLVKNAEDEVQKLTDQYVEKVDKLLEVKEKDIMTI
ncbi:ribosome recycling factor [Marinigracilibium pacificum]|uniref:Ribosome-recycling factor n=1 Tax=Marinigracilibium pacificum TaxID=2729599 RepID=A0A848IY77_9BACT|nr:ribosome recycling factor [Marinigracilibium pacificum]NMM49453.1 ribosome recycling factor [Marinigracilibium pacificum]